MERLTREKALSVLLAPIGFRGSIYARRNEVNRRRHDVWTALPFMNKVETKKAQAWLTENEHKALWD